MASRTPKAKYSLEHFQEIAAALAPTERAKIDAELKKFNDARHKLHGMAENTIGYSDLKAKQDQADQALQDILKQLNEIAKVTEAEPRSYNPIHIKQFFQNCFEACDELVTVTGDKSLAREIARIQESMKSKDNIPQNKAMQALSAMINLLPKMLKGLNAWCDNTLLRMKAASHGIKEYGDKEGYSMERGVQKLGKKMGRHNN